MLQRHFRVDPSEETHADQVLNEAAMKICRDAFSNIRLQVTNNWVKRQGQPVGTFRENSDTFLTAEQYGEVILILEHVLLFFI
jgi:hypothetical protein